MKSIVYCKYCHHANKAHSYAKNCVHSSRRRGKLDKVCIHSLLVQIPCNTPRLPTKNLHKHCFRFLLGHLHGPGEIANNDYAKFLGGKRGVLHGIVQVVNGERRMDQ